jgi:hypothetical protein
METAASLAWLDSHQAGAARSGFPLASRAIRAPWPARAGFFALIVSPVRAQKISHDAHACARVVLAKPRTIKKAAWPAALRPISRATPNRRGIRRPRGRYKSDFKAIAHCRPPLRRSPPSWPMTSRCYVAGPAVDKGIPLRRRLCACNNRPRTGEMRKFQPGYRAQETESS